MKHAPEVHAHYADTMTGGKVSRLTGVSPYRARKMVAARKFPAAVLNNLLEVAPMPPSTPAAPGKRFLICVSYYEGDRIAAEKMCALIADLEPAFNPKVEFVLFNRFDADPFSKEAFDRLERKFVVSILRSTTVCNGFPIAANEMWYDFIAQLDTEKNNRAYLGWLNLEPDCCPMRPGWLKEIIADYEKCVWSGKAVIGEVRPNTGPNSPQTHINGVAVYPINLASLDPSFLLRSCPKIGWAYDIFHAPQIVPMARDTPLIRVEWKKPTITPKELFQPHREGKIPALFHGVKDTSALDAVRAKYLASPDAPAKPSATAVSETTGAAVATGKNLGGDEIAHTTERRPATKTMGIEMPVLAKLTTPARAYPTNMDDMTASFVESAISNLTPAPIPTFSNIADALPDGATVMILMPGRSVGLQTLYCVQSLIEIGRGKITLGESEGIYDAFMARNRMADRFLQSGAKWSLWLDPDTIIACEKPEWWKRNVPAARKWENPAFAAMNAVNRLATHHVNNPSHKIVGATYFDRFGRGIPMFGAARDNPDMARALNASGPRDELISAGRFAGTGALLVHRDVYLRIQETQPEWVVDRTKFFWEQHGYGFFDKLDHAGDDVAFCTRAIRAGFQPMIDLAVCAAHIGDYCFTHEAINAQA